MRTVPMPALKPALTGTTRQVVPTRTAEQGQPWDRFGQIKNTIGHYQKPRQYRAKTPLGTAGTEFLHLYTHKEAANKAPQTPLPLWGEITQAENAPYAPYASHGAEQPALFASPAPAPAASPKSDDGMPAWLLRALEEKTGGLRAARWNRCTRCQQIILTGLDADHAAFTVHADPTPITTRQEQLCHTIGRPTYLLQQLGPRIELSHRDTYSIGRPTRLGPIIPAHKCGARFPGFHHPHPATGGTSDHPPF